MFETLFDALLSLMARGLADASWWQIVLYTLVTTHITIVSVTLFLHRAQAHRALDLHPAVAHFFRFWLWIGTGMVTKEWVAIHRKHHARCEQDGDPHSPVIFGIRKVLLEGADLYRVEARNQETMAKYGQGTPDDWVERHVYSRYTWQGVGLMLILDWALFGAIGTVVWVVQMLWIPITAAGIINGLGHWSGYRNFASRDTSHNVLPWGIVIGGEELHNNHHTYPTSAKFSVKPWEFDLGWVYIRVLQRLGLAHPKKVPPVVVLKDERPVGMATLHAVIAHRYDLMANYAGELRATLQAEIAHLRAEAAQQARHAGERATALRADLAARIQALSATRRWIKYDADMLQPAARQQLESAARASEKLSRMLAMREELRQIWERSNASAEQLVEQLRDWCKRAEESGIASLQALSLRMRSYA